MTDPQKTVLVTGASRGIGRALAAEYAASGAHVFAVARHPGGAADNVEWIAADIATPEGLAEIVGAVKNSGRTLDVLVNNAGIQQAIDLQMVAPEDFRAMAEAEIAVNLTAQMALSHGLLPFIRRHGGTIVNVTSILSRHPKAGAPVYCATKAGLASFTNALRHQLSPLGIRVVEAIPPLVDTAMTAGRGRGKLSPQAMAHAIVRGVARRRKRVAPGFSRPFLVIDRLLPELAAAMMIGN